MAEFSTTYYVNYDNVEEKKIDAEVHHMQVHMHNIYSLNLFYNYEDDAYSSFLMKGPEFTCDGIIIRGQEPHKKSILVKMDDNYDNFIENINIVSNQIYSIVNHYKDELKIGELHHTKNYIYQPTDEDTGEIIPDRQPSMFLTLYDKPCLPETTFFDLNGNVMDTMFLCQHRFTFIPLLHFYRVNINNHYYLANVFLPTNGNNNSDASIKIYIKEAIVTSILN